MSKSNRSVIDPLKQQQQKQQQQQQQQQQQSDSMSRRHTTSAMPSAEPSASSLAAGKRRSLQPPNATVSNDFASRSHLSFPASGGPSTLAAIPKHVTRSEEVDRSHSGQRTAATKLEKSSPKGSVSSATDFRSTVSSSASIGNFDPDDVEEPALSWSLRWAVDRVGRGPGEMRCPKDLLLTRGAGSFVAVTDSKNARVQLFSIGSGRLISVLGVDSDDSRTAKSFQNVADRFMQPTGICETPDASLLVATDLNRLLYIDASTRHRQLQAELVLKNRQHLSGVDITQNRKLILSETGIKPTVGLHENDGRLIREFKAGNFRTPSYVAWDEESQITAVSDSDQQCVLLYDTNSGKLLSRYGRADAAGGLGREPAALSYPAGICWTSDRRLLVADQAESRVVAFDTRNGSCEEVLTAERHGLRNPVAVATNRCDRLAVTEASYGYSVDEYSVKMFQLRPSREA